MIMVRRVSDLPRVAGKTSAMSSPPTPPDGKPPRILPANYRPDPKPAAFDTAPQGASWAELRRKREAGPPQPAAGPVETSVANPAGIVPRALAFAVDMALVWAVWQGAYWAGDALLHGARDAGTDLLGSIWTLLWPILYFGLLTCDGRRTVGMIAIRTRVLTVAGDPLGFWVACVRAALFLAGFPTLVPLLANAFLLMTDRHQGYHDRLTRALVVQE